MTIAKNKLKDLIHKKSEKDIKYLQFNPIESNSFQSTLKDIQKFVGKEKWLLIVIRDY